MAKTYNTFTNVATGDVYTASQHNAILTNLAGYRVPPTAFATHNTTQSLSTSTFTAIAFNTEPVTWDSDAIHDTAANNSRFTVTTTGLYLCTANITFVPNATGARYVLLRQDGTSYIGATSQPTTGGGDNTHISASWVAYLTATTYVEFIGYQSSGGALNIAADATGSLTYCRASVTWLGQVS